MSVFRDLQITRQATAAALLGIPEGETTERFVVERIGPEVIAPPMPMPPDCAADRTALDDVERRLTEHTPRWISATLLVGLLIVEAIGCALLLGSLGMPNPTRSVFGITIAACIFVLTSLTTHVGAKTTPTQGTATNGGRRWFYALITVYVVIVVAFTIVRMEELPADGEGTRAYDLSAAIILMCATIGPAWLAEITMRRLMPVTSLLRQRSLHRRRIAYAERAHARAVAAANIGKQRAEQWRSQAGRLRATHGARYAFVRRVVEQATAGRAAATAPSTMPAPVAALAPIPDPTDDGRTS